MTRVQRLSRLLNDVDIDVLLVGSMQNIRYLTGFASDEPDVAVALVAHNTQVLITDYRFAEQAREQCQGFDVFIRDRNVQSLGQAIEQILRKQGLAQLGFESDHFFYQKIQQITQDISSANCLPVSALVEQLRLIKDARERQAIARAAAIGDAALEQLLGMLKPGMTEKEAAIELEYLMMKAGADGLAFPTIFVSGTRSSYPHGMPTDKKLAAGEFIGIDFGATVDGYRSDMTRTVVMGKASAQQRKVYELVREAQQAGTDAVRAGIAGSVPHQHVADLLAKSDYADYVAGGLGHGVGLNLHEQPFLGANCEDVLEENMVITIEPGIYIPGWGGVRIEDDVRVTATGAECITQFPRTLIEL